MIVRPLRSLLPAALVLMVSVGAAQNSVDITTVPGQTNDIEVRLRFENDFDGLFAASVFTVRWSEASGASLGVVQQDAQVEEYQNVGASGPPETDNGYRYQVFAGFSTTVLSDIPLTLMAGEWITLCTIPVTGTDIFTVVNDAFTATLNGDYYVSLGGQESQGNIIQLNTGVHVRAGSDGPFNVYPSITSGLVTVEANMGDVDLTRLSVMNAAGQEVWMSPLSGFRGPLRRVIDLSKLYAGVYVVRLRALEGAWVARVVKR